MGYGHGHVLKLEHGYNGITSESASMQGRVREYQI
jgi:hypothetical protein